MQINTFYTDNTTGKVQNIHYLICSHCGRDVTNEYFYAGEFHHQMRHALRNVILCEYCVETLFRF